jgi:hypothetical protein
MISGRFADFEKPDASEYDAELLVFSFEFSAEALARLAKIYASS